MSYWSACNCATHFLRVGGDILNVNLEFGFFETGGSNETYSRFRLSNLRTKGFVPGYDLTNAVPSGDDVINRESGDGRWLAVETGPYGSPNSSTVINLYDWKTGELSNQLHRTALGELTLSEDGKYLACLDGAGEIYSVPGLEHIGQFAGAGDVVGVYRSPSDVFSGNLVALPIPRRNLIRLWNLTSREDVALLDQPPTADFLAFACDGKGFFRTSVEVCQT